MGGFLFFDMATAIEEGADAFGGSGFSDTGFTAVGLVLVCRRRGLGDFVTRTEIGEEGVRGNVADAGLACCVRRIDQRIVSPSRTLVTRPRVLGLTANFPKHVLQAVTSFSNCLATLARLRSLLSSSWSSTAVPCHSVAVSVRHTWSTRSNNWASGVARQSTSATFG